MIGLYGQIVTYVCLVWYSPFVRICLKGGLGYNLDDAVVYPQRVLVLEVGHISIYHYHSGDYSMVDQFKVVEHTLIGLLEVSYSYLEFIIGLGLPQPPSIGKIMIKQFFFVLIPGNKT